MDATVSHRDLVFSNFILNAESIMICAESKSTMRARGIFGHPSLWGTIVYMALSRFISENETETIWRFTIYFYIYQYDSLKMFLTIVNLLWFWNEWFEKSWWMSRDGHCIVEFLEAENGRSVKSNTSEMHRFWFLCYFPGVFLAACPSLAAVDDIVVRVDGLGFGCEMNGFIVIVLAILKAVC